MIKENTFSIVDISRELQIGTASTKFLINRFNPWIPQNETDNPISYPRESVSLLLNIKNELDAGALPSEIEQRLAENKPINTPNGPTPPLETMDLKAMFSLLNNINSHQERIAKASELRANAEDRKAAALEKRALAEEEKAKAMNNIAATLQQLPGLPDISLLGLGQLSDIPPESQSSNPSGEKNQLPASLDQREISPLEDLSELIAMESKESVEEELSQALLSDLPMDEDFMDDTDPSLDDLLDSSHQDETNLDDLSLLIDQDNAPAKEDDLWALVQDDTGGATPPLDDLGALVEKEPPLDDLNLLIKEDDSSPQPDPDSNLDDLNQLLDHGSCALDKETDDLYQLMDMPKQGEKKRFEKPDIDPKTDMAAYKAAIMKIIVQLKAEGLGAKETTEALNYEGIRTLSGRPQWKVGAISKIYRFIDDAN